ncbi:hypothetical protein JAAARDRAFT_173882 [Jaapia argillacea MUCL 33604]|uniref:Uncharacterized protein n=1 Tax=Jaapia argillacea MUCL 33604 TaxID=933084 RepID=A0A067Q539_9AGAM|nr:hypothetical protein JAAARDRAFT_173882 [Jaapia argillacea MUCL 33604]
MAMAFRSTPGSAKRLLCDVNIQRNPNAAFLLGFCAVLGRCSNAATHPQAPPIKYSSSAVLAPYLLLAYVVGLWYDFFQSIYFFLILLYCRACCVWRLGFS